MPKIQEDNEWIYSKNAQVWNIFVYFFGFVLVYFTHVTNTITRAAHPNTKSMGKYLWMTLIYSNHLV